MSTIQNGIWAGAIATAPMTLAMFEMQNRLPEEEKSPLPPATITFQALRKLGLHRELSAPRRVDATMISHFQYGIGCGVIYSLLRRSSQGSPLASGIAFGLGVWAFSYMVMLPAFGVRASAYKMPAKRNALMILAHVVWGATLGLAEKQMKTFGQETMDGSGKAPAAE